MTFKLNNVHKAVNWNVEDDDFTQAFWDQNVKQFWLPEEISVSKDVKVWSELSPEERNLYKKVLGGLTLLDTKQANNGIPSMMSLTDNLQRKAVLSFMGTMEEIHAKSYSSIFTTLLTVPEIRRDIWMDRKRADFTEKSRNSFSPIRKYRWQIWSIYVDGDISIFRKLFILLRIFLPIIFSWTRKNDGKWRDNFTNT